MHEREATHYERRESSVRECVKTRENQHKRESCVFQLRDHVRRDGATRRRHAGVIDVKCPER